MMLRLKFIVRKNDTQLIDFLLQAILVIFRKKAIKSRLYSYLIFFDHFLAFIFGIYVTSRSWGLREASILVQNLLF
jgi:hypothetical protein